MSHRTLQEYDGQLTRCRDLFIRKSQDYGTSWRVMRLPSLVDQIFIKAQRLRSIEDKGQQRVNDPVEGEYIGIVNYCIITLIQAELGTSYDDEIDTDELIFLYDRHAAQARELMEAKNHDYGEAWREMYIPTFTDLILTRILRIRQIMKNDGKTLVSEGIDSNLYDMVNYAIFALIKLNPASEA